MKLIEILILKKKNKISIFLSMILVLMLYSFLTNSNSPLASNQEMESEINVPLNTERPYNNIGNSLGSPNYWLIFDNSRDL